MEEFKRGRLFAPFCAHMMQSMIVLTSLALWACMHVYQARAQPHLDPVGIFRREHSLIKPFGLSSEHNVRMREFGWEDDDDRDDKDDGGESDFDDFDDADGGGDNYGCSSSVML